MKIEKEQKVDGIEDFNFKIEYAEYREETHLSRNLRNEAVFYVMKEAHAPVLIDNTLFKLEEGDTFIVPPFHVMKAATQSAPLRFYRITLPQALLEHNYPLLLAACANRKNKLSTGSQRESLFAACEALLGEERVSLFQVLSLLELLNAHVSPYTENDEEIELYECCLPLSLKKAMLYIKNHFKSRLTQEEIAKENGLSVARLHKLFCEHLGISPKAYLTLIRMQSASELLFCFASVEKTAHAIGYGSVTRFSSDFKACFGTSAGGYLKSGGLIEERLI